MIRSVAAMTCALLAATSLGACTSSSGAVSEPAPSPSVVTTPPPSVASSSSPPAPPASSASSSAPAPLSPFEADPAVRALRVWAAAGARAINAGRITSPAFDAAMTPALRKYARDITGGEQGHYYPGPVPFTPTRVQVRSGTEREVHVCVVIGGYSQNPKTHKPYDKRLKVQPVDAVAVRQGGLWLVSQFSFVSSFACTGVAIKQPSWSHT